MEAGGLGGRGRWGGSMTFCLKNKKVLQHCCLAFLMQVIKMILGAWYGIEEEFLFSGLREVPNR